MNRMEIDFGSWDKVAGAFTDASGDVSRDLDDTLTRTTDAGACNAANGLATVDGAVAIMLTVFGEVMKGTVSTSLRDGLASEGDALDQTGTLLRQMEDANTDASAEIEGAL